MHARVLKKADGAKGDNQTFWDIVKRQPDLEAVLCHGQIPKLVLQHDGHFVRILLLEALGDANAWGMCIEGYEKMVIAWNTTFLHTLKNGVHHPTQSVKNESLVPD